MAKANTYVTNINRLLKEVKSTISIDFIHTDNKGILITINNIASAFDLNIIRFYMRELNNVNHNDIKSPCLPQSKSYLKVLGISYLVKHTNLPIFFDIIENVIVTNFIQLVSPQPVDRFSQTKLCWKAPNEGYPHIYGMYKSNNK